MKSKFLTLAAVTVFLVSCNTKKTAVATTTTPVAPTAPVTEAPVAALSLELAEGQNLYNNNCANCHKLFEPKKFTKEEWTPILVSMGKKAHLDETQMASITNYIHSRL